MPLLRLPEPYDFELSTERFRAFGPDLANLWHEGGLHRVVGGREVRIEAAPGGVDVEPLDAEIEAEVRTLLGGPFELEGFSAWARTADPVMRRLVTGLEGFRPPLAPDPFETLVTSITAQQVSLFAAFAIRNRLIERYGERAGHAYAFPTRERIARATEEDRRRVGFSRRKAEYVIGLARSDLDLDGLAALPDDEVKARLTAVRGLRRVDGRLVPRAPPRPAARLARRATSACARPSSPSMVTSMCARPAPGFDPFQNLTAHYLLTGLRVVGT